MRFPTAVLALASVAVVSLSSCGEDQTAEYRKSFAPLSGDIVVAGRGVDEAIRTAGSKKNDAEVAVSFALLSSDAAHIAGSLAGVSAPQALSEDHARLISGLRRGAAALRRVSRAAIEGDARAVQAAAIEATRASADIRGPRRRIVAKLELS